MPRTTEQLKKAPSEMSNPGDYDGNSRMPLTDAEHEVEIYLNKQFAEVNVSDVLAKFAKAPYGWTTSARSILPMSWYVATTVTTHTLTIPMWRHQQLPTASSASQNKFTLRQGEGSSLRK